MLQNNGLELDASKVERLDAAAGRAGVRVRFRDGEEPRLEPSSGGVDGAIGRLLAIAATAAQNGTWRRLKACPRGVRVGLLRPFQEPLGPLVPDGGCGSLEKARAFRERKRAGAS